MENSADYRVSPPPPPRGSKLPVAKTISPPIPPPIPPPIIRRRPEVVRATLVKGPTLRLHFIPMWIATVAYVPYVFVSAFLISMLINLEPALSGYPRPIGAVDREMPYIFAFSAVFWGIVWAILMSSWWWDGRRKKLR